MCELSLSLVELHEVLLSPFSQPAQGAPSSSRALQHDEHSLQPSMGQKLAASVPHTMGSSGNCS